MKMKIFGSVLFFVILIASYLLLWLPFVYIVANFWVDLISGSGVENNLIIYWQYAAKILMFIILSVVPPAYICTNIIGDKQ